MRRDLARRELASSAPGRRPSSTASRCAADASAATSGGMLASVAARRAAALATSSSLPRPRSSAHSREVQRLALESEIRARDRQPLLRAAQVEIVARDFGRDEHLRVAQIRFGRLGVGAGGFRAAAHAAEQVELPERRDADVVRLDRRPARREARLLRRCSRCARPRRHVRASARGARRRAARATRRRARPRS